MVGVVVIMPTTVCWCSVDVGGNDVGVSVGNVIGIGGGVSVSGGDGNDDCGGVVGLVILSLMVMVMVVVVL